MFSLLFILSRISKSSRHWFSVNRVTSFLISTSAYRHTLGLGFLFLMGYVLLPTHGYAQPFFTLQQLNERTVGVGTDQPKAFLNVVNKRTVLFGVDSTGGEGRPTVKYIDKYGSNPTGTAPGSVDFNYRPDGALRFLNQPIEPKMIWYGNKGAFRAGGVYTGPDPKPRTQSGPSRFPVKYLTASSLSLFSIENVPNDFVKLIAYDSLSFYRFWDNSEFYKPRLNNAPGRLRDVIGDFSFASGANTRASGQFSTAMGYQTQALGHFSTAMGYKSWAVSDLSFVVGNYSMAGAPREYDKEFQTSGSDQVPGGNFAICIGSGSIASGTNSVILGNHSYASSPYSVAIGFGSATLSPIAYREAYTGDPASPKPPDFTNPVDVEGAQFSVAIGFKATSQGPCNMALGQWSRAIGDSANTLGYYTTASGKASLALGQWSIASGRNANTLGHRTKASGELAIALGSYNEAKGTYSTALGNGTLADQRYSTAIGKDAQALGEYSISMGYSSIADAPESMALGRETITLGGQSTALGYRTRTNGRYSMAMGNQAVAVGESAISLGTSTTANGTSSTAMGLRTIAGGANSTAMGDNTRASGSASMASGTMTQAEGPYSMAMGNNTRAIGAAAVSMGGFTIASGSNAIAAGINTIASGNAAVSLGTSTTASGANALAMGLSSLASGQNALAVGLNTVASGNNSTALGSFVSTNGKAGAFVVGDAVGVSSYSSTADNQLIMRFAGGMYLFTGVGPQTSSVGVSLAPFGNAWQSLSDSTRKENFRTTDGKAFLRKISQMRLGSWNYKGQDAKLYRHYGPMAQDFFAAFGHDAVGTIGEAKTINQADFDGVNLIAIKALIQEVEQLKADNQQLKAELDSAHQQEKNVQARLAKIEALLTEPSANRSVTFKP
ncbi:tail fiber domain-containing protein [Spirosoma validum]|uniref:Tail fiber domain-containing protein n=1 Tax=Spirosoma validum TaxID=2771355 RepID=A0A927GEV6_9BACT|nr:tail fiber domain-containing protein [Spirosoma validum]MBD2755199.1 tail fiber domain-containing protein [Spirosoma validum]